MQKGASFNLARSHQGADRQENGGTEPVVEPSTRLAARTGPPRSFISTDQLGNSSRMISNQAVRLSTDRCREQPWVLKNSYSPETAEITSRQDAL
jgi:hypothetical protein